MSTPVADKMSRTFNTYTNMALVWLFEMGGTTTKQAFMEFISRKGASGQTTGTLFDKTSPHRTIDASDDGLSSHKLWFIPERKVHPNITLTAYGKIEAEKIINKQNLDEIEFFGVGKCWSGVEMVTCTDVVGYDISHIMHAAKLEGFSIRDIVSDARQEVRNGDGERITLKFQSTSDTDIKKQVSLPIEMLNVKTMKKVNTPAGILIHANEWKKWKKNTTNWHKGWNPIGNDVIYKARDSSSTYKSNFNTSNDPKAIIVNDGDKTVLIFVSQFSKKVTRLDSLMRYNTLAKEKLANNKSAIDKKELKMYEWLASQACFDMGLKWSTDKILDM